MSDLISRKALLTEIRKRCGMWRKTAEIFCEVIEKQPPVEAVPTWIPCSERMPKHMTAVLVCTSAGEPFTAWYSHINKIWRNASTEMEVKADVIAWMPLPEPYMRKKV